VSRPTREHLWPRPGSQCDLNLATRWIHSGLEPRSGSELRAMRQIDIRLFPAASAASERRPRRLGSQSSTQDDLTRAITGCVLRNARFAPTAAACEVAFCPSGMGSYDLHIDRRLVRLGRNRPTRNEPHRTAKLRCRAKVEAHPKPRWTPHQGEAPAICSLARWP